jgi:DNA processing protein
VGSADAVLALSPREAAAASGLAEAEIAPFLTPRRIDGLAAQERLFKSSGARVLSILDEEYPALLRVISDAPPVLFARGARFSPAPAVAIVGSRRASRGGLEAARLLAGELARRGVIVVSGFARGIDAAAHHAALEAGGPTVAVFGCGADVCYPAEQVPMLEELLAVGTVLSEFPLGERPQPYNFPIRNRIIAALSRVVLVVEAALKSGSLITARFGAEYGRDVAAVPGSILQEGTAGSNALLKDGAILVRSAEDIIAELPEADRATLSVPPGLTQASLALAPPLDPDAAVLYAILHPDEPKDTDALAAATHLPAARLSVALVRLELEGLAAALPGAFFVRTR